MAISVETGARNGEANLTAALTNAGSLVIYSGTAPATANTALSGNTILATLTLPGPAFAAASGGTAVANAITGVNAVATGTASFYRIFKSDGTTVVWQGSVGTSGTDAIINTVSVVAGTLITVTSLNYARP